MQIGVAHRLQELVAVRKTKEMKALLATAPYLFHYQLFAAGSLLHDALSQPKNESYADIELVEGYLTYGGDVNQRSQYGESLAFLAALNGFSEEFSLLAACGAKMSCFEKAVIELRGPNEPSLTHALVKKLLFEQRSLIDEIGKKGFTLLHHSAANLQSECVKLLLGEGANANQLTFDGISALGLCDDSPDGKETIEILIGHGARRTRNEEMILKIRTGEDEEIMRRYEEDPRLLYAFYLPHWPAIHIVARFAVKATIARYVLQQGVDPNTPNETGQTPLHRLAERSGALQNVTLDLIQVFKEFGADANFPDNNGNTPLHVAVTSGSEDVVKLLVRLGADVSARNAAGFAPPDIVARSRFLGYRSLLSWFKRQTGFLRSRHS